MDNKLEKRELITLKWISYDYESLHTIVGNVSDDLGRSVSLEELHYLLSVLRLKGFAESYIYSPQDHQYVSQAPVGQYPQLDLLWYISENGIKYLEDTFLADE